MTVMTKEIEPIEASCIFLCFVFYINLFSFLRKVEKTYIIHIFFIKKIENHKLRFLLNLCLYSDSNRIRL